MLARIKILCTSIYIIISEGVFFSFCLFQRLVESVRSGTNPVVETSNTSGGTNDTSLQQTSPKSIHENSNHELEKTETEVFVQPLEDAELVNV